MKTYFNNIISLKINQHFLKKKEKDEIINSLLSWYHNVICKSFDNFYHQLKIRLSNQYD